MTNRTNRLAHDPGGLLSERSSARAAATPLELRDFLDEPAASRRRFQRFTEDANPENWRRANILPYETNTVTGETKWAVPGLLKGIFDSGVQAVTLLGRAMRGEVQMTDATGNVSQDAIAESLNFTDWALPVSAASRMGAAVPKGTASGRMPIQQSGNTSQTARRGLSEWAPQEDFSMHPGVRPTVQSATEAKSLVLFDQDFAQRQSDDVVRRLLGTPIPPQWPANYDSRS